ncbi:uncharacterized protein BCR38DRAFT_180482 [Pseudomassariella vexata]|uniref:Uncharacterized protein n=1 Tax=Pseudomassariella vexata TaxID=1141098 RepID=A0A1Y2E4K7_9PEZI|nr:uncharacterized protein BCR38DRAFT_180482 [Pseudomassariella vexata]ORY66449.1 hypothetical protein BCR38DRAFT_180482 [Pseudomassariella vexata]
MVTGSELEKGFMEGVIGRTRDACNMSRQRDIQSATCTITQSPTGETARSYFFNITYKELCIAAWSRAETNTSKLGSQVFGSILGGHTAGILLQTTVEKASLKKRDFPSNDGDQSWKRQGYKYTMVYPFGSTEAWKVPQLRDLSQSASCGNNAENSHSLRMWLSKSWRLTPSFWVVWNQPTSRRGQLTGRSREQRTKYESNWRPGGTNLKKPKDAHQHY